MKKVRTYVRNAFTIVVLFVYIFVMLFQYVPFLDFFDKVKAEDAGDKINLVGVFVDGNIYNSIKDDISSYANYIQTKNINTKALIFPIDTKNISSLDILKVINNLYFYGEKDKTSFLKTIVLIGDIPLPVVDKDGFIYKSIIPYVDVVKPAFSYNKKTGYFEYNGHSLNVELSHGIIKFKNIGDYHKYFQKLRTYAENPQNFVDKKFYLDNFVSQGSSLNHNLIKYYLNKIIFAENLITKKVTPLLLKYFDNQNKKELKELVLTDNKGKKTDIGQVIDKIGENKFDQPSGIFSNILGFNSSKVKEFDDIQKQYKEKTTKFVEKFKDMMLLATSKKNNYGGMPTLLLESSLKNFFRNYIQLFGNTYGGELTDNLKATGRYDWKNTISSLNSIDIKDKISVNYLKKVNDFLEKTIDKKIEEEKYFMYYPMMTSYVMGDDYNGKIWVCNKKRYENFYFGKNALDVNSLADLHIYRGTFGNFTGTDVLDKISSRGKKSNLAIVNNLFDTQTSSNRGNNVMIAQKDGQNYSKTCSRAYGACTNLGRNGNTELPKSWAMRIYGGYSPLNIDTDAMKKDPYNPHLKSTDYKQAWHPSYAPEKDGTLFDLGGTKSVENKISIGYTDTIDAVKHYSSVWETEYYTLGYHTSCVKHYLNGNNKIAGNYYDYVKDFGTICPENTSIIPGYDISNCSISQNGNTLTVRNKNSSISNDEEGDNYSYTVVYNYKFIDTRIKHTSPTKDEFSHFNMATFSRPVDSKNYISFLGVGGDTVKLDYPDIFNVYVYKEKNGILVLKSPSEIAETIKDYLRSIVRNYNTKLQKQLNKKDTYYNSYKKAWDNIGSDEYRPHNYDLLPENFLIDEVGEKKIAQIAEMLYYLNLGWKEKPQSSTLSGELNSLYKNFNITQKVDYIVKNYIDTESSYNVGGYDISHEDLNFPGKPQKGYEAGFIVSRNLDNQEFSTLKNNYKNNEFFNLFGKKNLPIDIENAKKECGKPLGEAVMIFKWPSAFICRLKETLKKPFKIGSTSECSVSSSLKSLKSVLDKQKKEKLDEEEYYNKQGKIDKYNKLKNIIENKYIVRTDKTTYSYEDTGGYIEITNYSDYNELTDPIKKIYIKSPEFTGNQFFIDGYKSTWVEGKGVEISNDRWKIPFSFYNLKTQEGRYYSYKAGEKIINITFCTKNDEVCYTKQILFDKSAGKLKYVQIKPFSDVMVYGGEDPFVIRGFDALPEQGRYQNEINGTIQSYKLYLDPSIGTIRTSIGQKGQKQIDYNFSSVNHLMSIKSNTEPINNINGFDIKLEIDKNWKNILDDDVVKSASYHISIAKKTNLNNKEVYLTGNIQLKSALPDDPYSLLTGNENYQTYDKTKLLVLHIEPKVYDKTLKTPVEIKDINGNFIPGTFQKTSIEITDPKTNKTKTITYEKFVKKNNFLITENTGIDVYLLPTYKTGPYKINIKIPGINTYSITGQLKDFPVKSFYLYLDKYHAEPEEKVRGKIYGIDKFGNLQDNIKDIDIIPSSGITVNRLDKNNIEVWGTKSGFITIKSGKVSNTFSFGINNTFLPIKDGKVSIMYLTLFGYDWGKYASKIMSNSSKNLAITTTLYDPEDIKKYDYIIKENLKTNNPTKLELNGDKTIFNFGNFTVNYSGKIFTTQIKQVESINDINSKGIFYIKEKTDDIIKTNYITDDILYVNGDSVINFSKNTQDSSIKIFSNPNYGMGVYDIFIHNHKVGTLIFNDKILDLKKLNLSYSFPTKIIPGSESSNGLKALGISISNEEYRWISDNTKIDILDNKKLGFRSNFRNITDFAAGLNVGDATKHFENEFLINFGDPFVKRISDEKTIEQVSMSKTYGYRIYSDIAGGIQKVVPIDFNNDGLKDIAILYNNGNLRFLKNYNGEGNFEDLGNLMVLGKPVKNMFVGDYNGDGYKDLFISFNDGTIRVYKNNHGEFSVDPYPICLDVAGTKDKMHFKLDQIFFFDMNNDKKTDIVTNDLVSDVKVFFGPSYVSDSIYKCSGIKLKEKLVKSYSYKIPDPNKKFVDDGYIYWEGFKDPTDDKKKAFSQLFENGKIADILKNGDKSGNKKIPTIENYTESLSSNNIQHFSTQDIPKVLGPSYVKIPGDTITFKKITFLSDSDPVDVYKTMEDLNGGNLLPGDKVKITLHVINKEHKKITYLESLKGPFAVISDNSRPILKFDNIPSSKVKIPLNYPEFLFQVDDYTGSFSISYLAIFEGSSSVKIKVDDFTKNNYGDIKVFLKNGCIKGYDFFKGKEGDPMSFDYEYVDLAAKLKEKTSSSKTNEAIDKTIQDIKNIKDGKAGLQDTLSKYIGGNDDIWGSSNFDTSNGDIDLDIDIGPVLTNIQNTVETILNGLCGGFGFGKAGCGGINIPCNMAFLAPGLINICGCFGGIFPGLPVFFYPGTVWTPAGPIPVPNGLEAFPIDSFIWAPGGVYPSFFRLYVTPTATASLGIATCFGSYLFGMTNPVPPWGIIAGNCIVAAVELPIPGCSKNKRLNADDEIEDWMIDLDNGVCSSLPYSTGKYPSTSITIPNGTSFVNSSIFGDGGSITALNGLVNFQMHAHKINSLKDARVLMKGGVPFSLHIETGTVKGLISCIIKKWLNKQIEFIINQLTQMTLYITYPDFTGLLKGFKEKDWGKFDFKGVDFSKVLKDFGIGKTSKNAKTQWEKKLTKYLPSKNGLKTLGKELSNPFEAVKNYFNDVPLINVYLKTVVIQVPWVGKDEIERQIAYLQNWIQRQKEIIKKWKAFAQVNSKGECKTEECKKAYDSILKVDKFINSVQKNIEILNEYKNFPLKLYKYMHLLDFYLSQIACIINKYVDMIVGWINRNSKIFEKWVDAIITMINIIKTWQLLIDVSLDWKTTCGKCRVDFGDIYDCILSLLCGLINLPVLPIPPFKLPDIFIDFSHINLGVDIVLPKIKVYPIPIGMFTLPDLPYPAVSIELPALPLLPQPPSLPDLPSLPALPTVELPNLPPAPKIPKLLPAIRVLLKIFKFIGWVRCIIKNGIGLTAERDVRSRIEQLTERKNRIFPFDFLVIDFPLLPWAGFDVRLDAYLKLRLELSQVYDAVKHIADNINKRTGQSIDNMLDMNLKLQNSIDNFNMDSDSFRFDIKLDKQGFIFPKKHKRFVNIDFNQFIVNNKPVDIDVAKGILFDELSYFLSQKNEDYMNSIPDSIYKRAEKLKNNAIHKAKVSSNTKGVYKIQNEFTKLLQKQKIENNKILKAIKDMEKGKKVDLSSDIFYKTGNNLVNYNKENNKHIIYKAKLFSIDKKSQSIIDHSENPNLSYLKIYKKVLTKFVEKAEKYKNGKPKMYYQYKELENKAKQSLDIINTTLGQKFAYTSTDSSSNGSSTSSPKMVVDPSQFIRGLYMKGTDGTYYNVLNDKKKAKKIRENKTYILEDINNDGKKDMIWYDSNSVYIKYSDDKPEKKGIIITKEYIYSDIISNFKNIVDKDGFIELNGEKFKIWDEKNPVNDLKLKGQTASSIRLGWTHDKTVNSYTLVYSSRIDVLNDLETKYSYTKAFVDARNFYNKYAVIVYDKKLGKMNEVKASKISLPGVVYKIFVPVDFNDKDRISSTLKKTILKFHKKWKYFRIYKSFLNLELNKLKLLSTYSNQEVGAEQILSDETSPDVVITLRRPSLPPNEVHSEIVGTGTHLHGFVNTKYVIKGKWTDNVKVKSKWIMDEKFNFINNGDTLPLEPFQEPTKKVYYFMADDYNGNISKVKVTLNIGVPDIKIDKIDSNHGTIYSSISSDMDKTAVKFGIKTPIGLKIIKNLNGKDLFTGGALKTIFTGAIFDNDKKIIFYDPLPNSEVGDNPIGSLNLKNGEIKINSDKANTYYVLGTVNTGRLIYHIYNQEAKKMFSIYLPPKELVNLKMDKTDNFEKMKINNSNLGIFNDGYCIKNKTDNKCAVYISKKGLIYVNEDYRDNFVVDYNFNENGVNSTFYNIPVPNKSFLTEDNKIFTIIYKVKDMSK